MDLLLDLDGDLIINETGDIELTDSIRQAIKIRLLWFAAEWRFDTEAGIPYFEKVFVKNPNLLKIRGIVRAQIIAVDGVDSVQSIDISVDKITRSALISYVVHIGNDNFKDEVRIFERVKEVRPNT